MNTLVKTSNDEITRFGKWAIFRRLMLPAFKAHAPLFVILAAHFAFTVGLALLIPEIPLPSFQNLILSFAGILLVLAPLSIASLRLYHLAINVKPKHPIPALWREMRDFLSQPARAANGSMIILIFAIFVYLFTHLKGAITLVNPFAWDMTFMEWDRWLHFGYHPYEILQPLLGYAPITFVITVIYHLWFMVMWIMVAGMAFARVSTILRMQFFLTFMLSWIVGGNVLAMIFSSAGPCYYGLIGLTPDPFTPLMNYLHNVHETIPLWAVDTQTMLWDGYTGNGLNLGISAMPSMHNGAALLFALAGWQINRKLGIGLYVFAAFIFLGSIHLGWHYAIDSYAGFAVALLAWWISGWIAKWWETTRWSQDYAQLLRQTT